MRDHVLLRSRDAVHFRVAAGVTVAACVAAGLLPAPALEIQVAVAAAATLFLGFPHGALDPLVASAPGEGSSPRGTVRFFGAYLALALAVVGLWLVAPLLGLGLFLITSAAHFGDGDVPSSLPIPRRWVAVAAHGSAPIALPVAFHASEVGVVFGWLVGASGPSVAAWLVDHAAVLGGGWLMLAVAAHAGTWDRAERRSVLELAILTGAFALLPPLLSFAIYFCVWHSVRHLLGVDAVLGPGMRMRAAAVGGGILALTAVLLAAFHLSAVRPQSAPAVIRTIFIALAALTPPHMLVTAKLAGRLRAAR